MTDAPRKSARVQLALIALVFFGPLVVAAWMYYGGYFAADGARTNTGALLEPIVNLRDALPESAVLTGDDGSWILLYANQADCDTDCRQALYTLRQSHKMLGREVERVTRVFLHGETAPDTVFITAEHQGLITAEDASLDGLLENKRPANLPMGGYFLIDPLGNLVMYFQPDIDPYDMVDDIKRLLRLSRIG